MVGTEPSSVTSSRDFNINQQPRSVLLAALTQDLMQDGRLVGQSWQWTPAPSLWAVCRGKKRDAANTVATKSSRGKDIPQNWCETLFRTLLRTPFRTLLRTLFRTLFNGQKVNERTK